jgi:hypothetical protein
MDSRMPIMSLQLTLHTESRPMFDSNQAFLLVQKLKSASRALHLRLKAEIEKFFSIYPKLLIDAELLWPCIGPKA